MFEPTFGFKNLQKFQLKEYNIEKLQSSWFLSSYTGKVCTALYFSRSSVESLKWPIMGASTLEET